MMVSTNMVSIKLPWIAAMCLVFICWATWFREVPFASSTFGNQKHTLPPDAGDNNGKTAIPESHKGDGKTSPNERPLILYAFSESEEARSNIQFFIDHALHDAADFIFILNGETDIDKIIPQKDNIKQVKRPNDCFDLGSYAEVLTKDDFYKKYRKFIMMNASLRGPFLPSWIRSCWSSLYLSRITSTTKLVGMTANCVPEFHIQSMIWVTDLIGLEILLFPPPEVVAKLPPLPMYAIKGPFNESETHPPGINSCFHSFNGAINAEIGVTPLIRTAGYGVEAMMTAFHGVAAPGDTEAPSDASEYEKFCKSTAKTGDVLHENAYFGVDIHPYETVFMKTNRNIGPVVLDHLTTWAKGSGFNSYNCEA